MSFDQYTTDSDNQAEVPPDSYIDHAASIKYWNGVPATSGGMLGMLGDYPWYSRIDLRGSRTFLAKAHRLVPSCKKEGKLHRGVDCGAGVGRITEGFLGQVCEVMDAVEPVEKFARALKERVPKMECAVEDVYIVGLEGWVPEKKYDLIWIQFCVGHLTDVQLRECFVRCKNALTETGMLVIKENNSTDVDGEDIYDELDSSVTRTDAKLRQLFNEAGLNLITSEIQAGFPKSFNLFPVKMYALRPKT
ncbi:N-terminal protein methyltransferase [Aspergillus candidus]|uniref:Alpha N-terminal protein methyltransferase 1 n=1 Tax=Aspergillus candidus TaxID=41067 RepID=A0A2I2FGL5_ASPCN|nr:DUF858 domain protein [Aspergillus candidus]PLB39778.1 DUF858 domain protein [Aspergillus candidus]